jgi:hypothetical protein
LCVALRGLLVLPQLLVAWVLGSVAGLLAIIGWFAALALGRLPRWIAVFELKAIAYGVRVNAYTFLLVDEYPPFSFAPVDYPIAVLAGAARLSRLKVFFRWLLAIPVYIVSAIAGQGLLVLSPIIWLLTLARGRTPQAIFSAAAAVIRYQARLSVYMGLVTDEYPSRLFGDSDSELRVPEGPGRESLVLLSAGAKRIMWLIVVLPIVIPIGSVVLRYELRPAPPPRNPAVVAAEGRLGNAAVNAVAVGTCSFRCEETHERALGEAYLRFASSLSRISFSGSQRRQVPVLIFEARTFGRTLLAASKSKDGGRRQGIDPADPGDSLGQDAFDSEIAGVLGPGPPGGIIR